MKRILRRVVLGLVLPVTISHATEDSHPVKVDPDNFVRAESDLYFGRIVRDGGFGKFHPTRALPDVDRQIIIRLNRDTLYSAAVIDLDAGPATLVVPNPGKRFLSVQVINEDHYTVGLIHQAGAYTFTKESAGTRYILLGVRIFVDANSPDDFAVAHRLQDELQVKQRSQGAFVVPDWDRTSQDDVRRHLVALATMLPNAKGMFGSPAQVTPVHHLLGAAFGWGGNPESEATYLNVAPAKNDGKTTYALTVGRVPVKGFWSISVYNAEGYYERNPFNVYSINNITAHRQPDGSIRVQFGHCGTGTQNCIPIMKNWNYMVRLYLPDSDITDGAWTFPVAKPIDAL